MDNIRHIRSGILILIPFLVFATKTFNDDVRMYGATIDSTPLDTAPRYVMTKGNGPDSNKVKRYPINSIVPDSSVKSGNADSLDHKPPLYYDTVGNGMLGGLYLKLDQTTPQSVVNGVPLFNLGVRGPKWYPNADSAGAIKITKADGTTSLFNLNTLTGTINTTLIKQAISGVNEAVSIGSASTTNYNYLLSLIGAYPGIYQSVERASGGIAFPMFNLYGKNTTSGLSGKLGEIGVLGNLTTAPTNPFAYYLYMGADATTTYNDNAFRVYAGKVVYCDYRLGIAVTDPDEKLEVTGNVRLTADNNVYYLGTDKDAGITYNGTDMVVDPNLVGTGKLLINGEMKLQTPTVDNGADYVLVQSSLTDTTVKKANIDSVFKLHGIDGECLKLDQTTPQTVVNGVPIFENGIRTRYVYGSGGTSMVSIFSKVGINKFTPSAYLHLPPSTSNAGTASLKIDSGQVSAEPEPGSIESDGSHLYWTDWQGNRKYLDALNYGTIPDKSKLLYISSSTGLPTMSDREYGDATGDLLHNTDNAITPFKIMKSGDSSFVTVGNGAGGADPDSGASATAFGENYSDEEYNGNFEISTGNTGLARVKSANGLYVDIDRDPESGGEFRINANGVGHSEDPLHLFGGGNTTNGIFNYGSFVNIQDTVHAEKAVFIGSDSAVKMQSVSDTSFLSTKKKQLIFKTLDTTRMTITNSGNVGIGTSTPTEKLQVLETNYSVSIRLGGGNTVNQGRMFIHVDTEADDSYIDCYGNNSYKKLKIDVSELLLNQNSGGSVVVGSPTGGSKGAGTINATGLYKNGSPALTYTQTVVDLYLYDDASYVSTLTNGCTITETETQVFITFGTHNNTITTIHCKLVIAGSTIPTPKNWSVGNYTPFPVCVTKGSTCSGFAVYSGSNTFELYDYTFTVLGAGTRRGIITSTICYTK